MGLTVGRPDLLLKEPTFLDGDGRVLDLYDAWQRVDRDPLARRQLVALLRVMQQYDVR